jgi:hypothetical protein
VFESAIKYVVERGGVGSLFGLIMCWVSYKMWERNNVLQDSKNRMAEQVADALTEGVKEREKIREVLSRIEARLAASENSNITHG